MNSYLLAEAVRLHEEATGDLAAEPHADAEARASGGGLEERIVARARASTLAASAQQAIGQLRGASTLVLLGGIVFAVSAGAGAGTAVLGSSAGAPVNFFRALVGLLGIPTLALIWWVVLISIQPGGAAVSVLGRAVLGIGARLARWAGQGPVVLRVIRAAGSLFTRSAVGRWGLSAISHALWLAYLCGMLGVVLLLLSTKEFTFVWETTILSERSYVALTQAIATFPGLLGFAAPQVSDVVASQTSGEAGSIERVRDLWASLLIGSLLVYGALPRALLLIFCLVAAGRAARRLHLDISHPGYARLRPRLLPGAQSRGVIDPEPAAATPAPAAGAGQLPLALGRQGRIAVLGLEVDPPTTGWPPSANDVDWVDLGFIDDRSSRRRVSEQICQAPIKPSAVVIVCSLAQTPDRGSRTFIDELQQQSGVPALVVLTGGQQLRARGQHQQLAQRVEDWRQMAAGAAVPDERVIELDLDHLTEVSQRRLRRWLGVGGNGGSMTPRIARAFALIVERAGGWQGPPATFEQAELQRAIADLYRDRGEQWQDVLRLRLRAGASQADRLKAGAEGMLSVLPTQLKGSARWLSAGAVAGALACVAAATLIAPAAIATLPAWAGLGAAVATALQWAGGRQPAEAAVTAEDFSQAIAGTTLFALVLHLQGRNEAQITAILDHVLAGEDVPTMRSAAAAQAWLDGIAQRLEQTMAGEGARSA